jgi:hypothetical protein
MRDGPDLSTPGPRWHADARLVGSADAILGSVAAAGVEVARCHSLVHVDSLSGAPFDRTIFAVWHKRVACRT